MSNTSAGSGAEDDGTFYVVRCSPDERYSVVVDDDGRVAYAYLRDGEQIVADVWLYNRCETPQTPTWADRSKHPFVNPASFARENDLGPLTSEQQVRIEWGDGAADIYLHGRLWATFRSGDKPGSCVLATRNGPLAKVLENT